MPTVEALSPQMIWNTLYGIIAIGLIFLIVYKIYDAIYAIQKRRRERIESARPDFAEKVSQKVIDKLEPRFQEIETNLNRDKKRLENHEALLTSMKKGNEEIHDGLTAICKFMLVISTYGNLGNHERVKEASTDLQKFLAERL